MSKIYGFYAGSHDPTIAYIEDGEIKSVIQEERIKRIKSGNDHPQNPYHAHSVIEKETGVAIQNADFIACSTPVGYKWIKDANLPLKGVRSFDHQYCHAVGAYLTSGFKGKCLTFTYDGGGEHSNGGIWLCEGGNMTQIKEFSVATDASLGRVWMAATEALGWKMLKDEGKVMGMAGNGEYNEFLYNTIKTLFEYDKDNFKFSPSGNGSLATFVFNSLKDMGWCEGVKNRYDLAYNLQKCTEDVMLEIIQDFIIRWPEHSKQMCFAGGIFANVKMNYKINNLKSIDEIFIYPPMGDDGLALGAAIAMAKELGEWELPKKLPNMFMGVSYDEKQIEQEASPYNFKSVNYDPQVVANHLDEGQIGAFFKGKFEHGPRALGARSIIVKTTEKATHELLNTRLKRHEVMPFAPMVLKDKANDIFYGADKSSYTAEFMTLCYLAKEEWIPKIPACIHNVDNTGRPQFVNPKTNPHWYELLKAYYDKTGIPVLLNTSFNGHGEPIVNTPTQAFEHLKNKTIDFLIVENKIYYRNETL